MYIIKNFIKPLIIGVAVCMCSIIPVFSLATNITGNTGTGTMTVTVQPTIISAVVPTNITATIKPNSEIIDYMGNSDTDATDTFIAPQFTVTNNSNAPVNLALTSITPKDGAPSVVPHNIRTEDEWKNLTNTQSLSEIAFGFKLGGKWKVVTTSNGWFSPGTNYNFGALNRKSSVTIDLQSKYGLSFTTGKTYNYDVVYALSLT